MMADSWRFLLFRDGYSVIPTSSEEFLQIRIAAGDSCVAIYWSDDQIPVASLRSELERVMRRPLTPLSTDFESLPSKTQRFPVFGFTGVAHNGLLTAELTRFEKTLLIHFRAESLVRRHWPANSAALTRTGLEASCANFLRQDSQLSFSKTSDSLPRLLAEESAKQLDRLIDVVVEKARSAMMGEEIDSLPARRDALISLIDTRLNLQGLRRDFGLFAGDSGATLRDNLSLTIEQLDVVGASLASIASLDLNSEVEALRRVEQSRTMRDNRIEQRLTRFAATFVLPGLWIGFLGSNTIPTQIFNIPTHNWLFTLAASVVTLLLAGAGWRWSSSSRRRNHDE